MSDGAGRGARLGGAPQCKLFYKGTEGKILYTATHNPESYNSFKKMENQILKHFVVKLDNIMT